MSCKYVHPHIQNKQSYKHYWDNRQNLNIDFELIVLILYFLILITVP